MSNKTGLCITVNVDLVDVGCGEREGRSRIKPGIMTC